MSLISNLGKGVRIGKTSCVHFTQSHSLCFFSHLLHEPPLSSELCVSKLYISCRLRLNTSTHVSPNKGSFTNHSTWHSYQVQEINVDTVLFYGNLFLSCEVPAFLLVIVSGSNILLQGFYFFDFTFVFLFS